MKNHYLGQKVKIRSIQKLTDNLKIFTLTPGDDTFIPGQFYMLGIPGFAEAPFTPTNFPSSEKIQFLIQQKPNGCFTTQLFKLKKDDILYLRGPYGKGFPFSDLKRKNIALIAGGCGLAPLHCALEYLYRHYQNFGQMQLFYGVNTPDEIAFKNNLESKKDKIELLITVANPTKGYRGNIGFIDKLITKNTILSNTVAILCGPPVMYESVIKKLIKLKVREEDIYLQLERRMHCGMGHCQHCTCGEKYVCLDGPIFSYQELLRMNSNV